MRFATAYPARLRPVLLLAFWLGIFVWGNAQVSPEGDNRVSIDHADKLKSGQDGEHAIQRLLGNVKLTHDTTTMYCDSAWRYLDTNYVVAYSRVRIELSTERTIRSQKLTYDGTTKIIDLYRDVVLSDSSVTIKTPHMRYYREDKYGVYDQSGQVLSEDNVLTSRYGYYYPDEDMAYFKEDVVLVNPDYTLYTDTMGYHTSKEIAYFMDTTRVVDSLHSLYTEGGWYDTRRDVANLHPNALVKDEEYWLWGDSIYYDRKADFGTAYRDIHVMTSDSGMNVYGQYGWFRSGREESMITDSAFAVQLFENDTMYLFADTLRSIDDSLSGQRVFRGYNQAHFYMSDLQGACDSLIYFYDDSSFYMLQEPILWSGESQITGDTIMIGMKDSKADTMSIIRSGFIISREETVGYNQISGRNIFAKFRDNDLYRMWVVGNSESIYYAKDDAGSSYVGMNQAQCSHMFLTFEEGKPQTIRFYEKPQGTFLPLADVYLNPPKLKGFDWRPDNRPEKPLWVFYPDSARAIELRDSLLADSLLKDSLLQAGLQPNDSTLTDSLRTDSLPARQDSVVKGQKPKGETEAEGEKPKKKCFLVRFFQKLFGKKEKAPEPEDPPATSGKGKVKDTG